MHHATRYALALGLLAAADSGAAVFTVGSDGDCTHANILAAVIAASNNGAGLDEIRLATNQTYSNVIAPITSHSVHLPKDARVQVLTVNGEPRPLRNENGGGDGPLSPSPAAVAQPACCARG